MPEPAFLLVSADAEQTLAPAPAPSPVSEEPPAPAATTAAVLLEAPVDAAPSAAASVASAAAASDAEVAALAAPSTAADAVGSADAAAAPLSAAAAAAAAAAAVAAVATRLGIRPDLARKLPQLGGFDVALVLDDSGSMSQSFPGSTSRWAHLLESAMHAIDVCRAAAQPPRPVDAYFLNRDAVRGITDAAQLRPAFASRPHGFTPLTRVFREALATGRAPDGSRARPLLVVIMTDGLPTDDDGEDEVEPFLAELRALPGDVHVQLVAFAEASGCLHYVQDLKQELARLDVSDIFPLEKERMLQRHVRINAGSEADFAFSLGDYLASALLAPIDADKDQEL